MCTRNKIILSHGVIFVQDLEYGEFLETSSSEKMTCGILHVSTVSRPKGKLSENWTGNVVRVGRCSFGNQKI